MRRKQNSPRSEWVQVYSERLFDRPKRQTSITPRQIKASPDPLHRGHPRLAVSAPLREPKASSDGLGSRVPLLPFLSGGLVSQVSLCPSSAQVHGPDGETVRLQTVSQTFPNEMAVTSSPEIGGAYQEPEPERLLPAALPRLLFRQRDQSVVVPLRNQPPTVRSAAS
jgi:hypothetical protein